MRVHEMDQQVAEHKQIGIGDDLVEGVLQKRLEPSPEQPFHLRDDKKRNKDRPQQDADTCCDVAERNNKEDGGFGQQNGNDKHGKVDDLDDAEGQNRHLQREVDCVEPLPDFVGHRVVQAIRQREPLVGDQMVEADADTRQWPRVVRNHCEAKGDRHEQLCKVIELESAATSGGG